jgi:hypothetical protein
MRAPLQPFVAELVRKGSDTLLKPSRDLQDVAEHFSVGFNVESYSNLVSLALPTA